MAELLRIESSWYLGLWWLSWEKDDLAHTPLWLLWSEDRPKLVRFLISPQMVDQMKELDGPPELQFTHYGYKTNRNCRKECRLQN